MKQRDVLTPIGIIFGILMISYGIISSSGLLGFLDFIVIPSIVIVFGGVIAAILINFNISQVKLTGKVIKESFSKNGYNLEELILLFEQLSERARREGLLALESELDEVEDP